MPFFSLFIFCLTGESAILHYMMASMFHGNTDLISDINWLCLVPAPNAASEFLGHFNTSKTLNFHFVLGVLHLRIAIIPHACPPFLKHTLKHLTMIMKFFQFQQNTHMFSNTIFGLCPVSSYKLFFIFIRIRKEILSRSSHDRKK